MKQLKILNALFMKMIFLIVTGLLLVIASCNNNEDTETGSVTDATRTDTNNIKPTSQVGGCYLMIQGKDTASLQMTAVDGNVSGTLQYRRFEKDDNDGTIKGSVRDGLIDANYTFQSEGTTSVRQVVFSIKGDSLYEGYGEIKVTADSAAFINTSQLKFLPVPFVKIDCEQ